MYVGSVYWFLSMATDLNETHIVTIFDCESGTVVWNSDDHWVFDDDDNSNYQACDILLEVGYSKFGDYEIDSYDLYEENGRIHLEINISIEEDE